MAETEIKSTQERCLSCGGNVKFSPEEKALKCVFCGSLEKIDFTNNNVKHNYEVEEEDKKEYANFAKNNKVFKCKSCGAQVVLNKLEVSKVCPYCLSPCAIDSSEKIGLKPDSIIPFKFSQNKASVLFKQGLKKKWFIPNKFKKSPPIDKIKGVYVPCFSFDAKSSTTYFGELAKQTTSVRNGKTHTHTRHFRISGTKDLVHQNVLVETSSHLDQKVFNSIKPYNIGELVDFKTDFIMGYSVEHYDQALENCKQIADNMIKESIKNTILSKYDYTYVVSYNQQTKFSDELYSYYILPTYQVNYTYKNKNYTTFMNGQTGKVGSGLPKSAIKITFFSLFVALIIIGILILFFVTD